MYRKCYHEYAGKNKSIIHLWDDEDGYSKHLWKNEAYIECSKNNASYRGMSGEWLQKVTDFDRNDENLHFHDMTPNQKFLIEKYGINDNPSTGHNIGFFDIEIKLGGKLTEEYIESCPQPVTSIAFYRQSDNYFVTLIWDEHNALKHTISNGKEIIPVESEEALLAKFVEIWVESQLDIISHFNGDYFDIPYLYYRICKVLGEEWGNYLSPIGKVKCKKNNNYWYSSDSYVQILGVESMDYMRLHKKYSWKEEPSYQLGKLGEKYLKLPKIEYNGTLDDLFRDDPETYVEYNFRDVEILIGLEKKWNYLGLTLNISHKGKHNYSDVYYSSISQDGAISSFLLSKNIIPPAKQRYPIHKFNYAGGFLYCATPGIYKYVFDEDLTSLYPAIIRTLNCGRETYVGNIVLENDRDSRKGLDGLRDMNSDSMIKIENVDQQRTDIKVKDLIKLIEENNYSISANGVMYTTHKKSSISEVLELWFNERVEYKTKMKVAYKKGDKVEGDYWYLRQYTIKILLNSTYGALSLKGFRYGGDIRISESITLSGQRIIQESGLFANSHMNGLVRNEEKMTLFKESLD
jgi:DNA polymerase elongation subunit (family B)